MSPPLNRAVHLHLEPLEDRIAMAGDPVLEWNGHLLQAIRTASTPPPQATRNLALMHTAIFDAVNAVDQSHAFYAVKNFASGNTSREAAVVAAAYRVLLSLYPGQIGDLNTKYKDSLEDLPSTGNIGAGVDLGRSVADRVLALRGRDGSDRQANHADGVEPGDWRRTPPEARPPLTPRWGDVTPWALLRANQFPPAPLPNLDSAEYTAAFNEVKAKGSLTGSNRTAEETDIAKFWANGAGTVTPPGHWNQVASLISAHRALNVSANARLFALLNVALADAAIACWDVKYETNFWRPITGIRLAADDGNDATTADPAWEPLLTTPQFPTYTSGHSTFSAAAAIVLANFFRRDDIRFTLPSQDPTVPARTFTRLSAAALESANSRLFAGIHWRFDNLQGLLVGQQIGAHVIGNFLVSDPNGDFRWVGNVYRDLLNRTARPDELRTWVRRLRLGATRAQVVQGFLASLEYRENLVNAFYRQLLDRDADERGLRHWTGLLGRGVRESAVLAGIAGSDEFLRKAGGGNLDGYVRALYREILGRPNVSTADVDVWLGALVGPSTRGDVAFAFTGSREFRLQLLDGNRLSYGGWYRDYLHRAADLRGALNWLGNLQINDYWRLVQIGLLSSQEHGRF